MGNTLKLNDTDPRVVAAHAAEQQLWDFYGLQAKTHYIMFPQSDMRMRVSETGTGAPVIIVPGNTGDVFPLIPLIAHLKGRRVIAINRPGGGLSDGIDHSKIDLQQFAVQMITAVLNHFELDTAPIIAHSIGGHMSLLMAMAQPDRVSALTLLGVPGNIIGTGPPFALRLLSIPGLNSLLFNLIAPKKPNTLFKAMKFMGHPAESLARIPAAMADCYYYFQQLPYYRLSSLSLMERGNLFGASALDRINAGQLKTVQQPTLMHWGTNDPFGSVATGRQIAGLLPRGTFNAITGGGHLPWLDKPREIAELTLSFLSGY